MPTISSFYGIRIDIKYNDHVPPHIHVKYGEHEATIKIKEIELHDGFLPKKQLRLVLAWCELHQNELMKNWELARDRKKLLLIEPLK